MEEYAPNYKHSLYIGSCNQDLAVTNERLEYAAWEMCYYWALAMSEASHEVRCLLAYHSSDSVF